MTTDVTAPKQYGLSTHVDYGDDAGLGTEGIDKGHFSPPMLNILQFLSPQVKAGEGKAGDILNTGSGAIFSGKDGIEVIPCAVDHYYTEWRPRTEGGGFLGRHEVSSPVVAKALADSTEFGKYNTPRGSLAETFVLYALVITENGPEPVVIPFTSTKISIYKKFISKVMAVLVNGKKPPIFAHVYKFVSEEEKRAKGESFNWRMSFVGGDAAKSRLAPDSPLYAAAKEFSLAVRQGAVKHNDAPGNASASAGAGSSHVGDDDIPF